MSLTCQQDHIGSNSTQKPQMGRLCDRLFFLSDLSWDTAINFTYWKKLCMVDWQILWAKLWRTKHAYMPNLTRGSFSSDPVWPIVQQLRKLTNPCPQKLASCAQNQAMMALHLQNILSCNCRSDKWGEWTWAFIHLVLRLLNNYPHNMHCSVMQDEVKHWLSFLKTTHAFSNLLSVNVTTYNEQSDTSCHSASKVHVIPMMLFGLAHSVSS